MLFLSIAVAFCVIMWCSGCVGSVMSVLYVMHVLYVMRVVECVILYVVCEFHHVGVVCWYRVCTQFLVQCSVFSAVC